MSLNLTTTNVHAWNPGRGQCARGHRGSWRVPRCGARLPPADENDRRHQIAARRPRQHPVNAILDDIKSVTSTVKGETSRLNQLFDWILDAIGRRRDGLARPTRVQ